MSEFVTSEFVKPLAAMAACDLVLCWCGWIKAWIAAWYPRFLAVRAIIEHRHRNCGLLLSELGAYVLSPSLRRAPSGFPTCCAASNGATRMWPLICGGKLQSRWRNGAKRSSRCWRSGMKVCWKSLKAKKRRVCLRCARPKRHASHGSSRAIIVRRVRRCLCRA